MIVSRIKAHPIFYKSVLRWLPACSPGWARNPGRDLRRYIIMVKTRIIHCLQSWTETGCPQKSWQQAWHQSRATVYKAQVRSIMEYACLCWTSASSTTLSQLDNIQRKALKIIGVNEATARTQLSIPSLTHRREVAAVTVFYKVYTRHCPIDLYMLRPPPLKRKRVTRSSTSMPDHALTVPDARTNSLDRSFVHSTVRIWNSLPDAVVGDLSVTGLNSFKGRAHEFLLNRP